MAYNCRFGEKEQLTCHVQGFPIDKYSLSWTYQDCQNFETCSDSKSVSPDLYSNLEPHDGLSHEDYHYSFQSSINVTVDSSRIYSCEVCNFKNDCQKSSIDMFVSDVSKDGFGITGPGEKEETIEGDRVNLQCSGSIYR